MAQLPKDGVDLKGSLTALGQGLIEQALGELTPDNYEIAVKLASLPDIIRGYEDIKLTNVDRFWDEVGQLGYADSGTRTMSPAMSSAGD